MASPDKVNDTRSPARPLLRCIPQAVRTGDRVQGGDVVLRDCEAICPACPPRGAWGDQSRKEEMRGRGRGGVRHEGGRGKDTILSGSRGIEG